MKIQTLNAENKLETPFYDQVTVALKGTVPVIPEENTDNFRNIPKEREVIVDLKGSIDSVDKKLLVNLEGVIETLEDNREIALKDDFAVTLRGKLKKVGDKVVVNITGQIDSEIESDEANQESLGQQGLVLPKLKELPPYGRIKEWREEGFGLNNSDSRRLTNGRIGPNSWDD